MSFHFMSFDFLSCHLISSGGNIRGTCDGLHVHFPLTATTAEADGEDAGKGRPLPIGGEDILLRHQSVSGLRCGTQGRSTLSMWKAERMGQEEEEEQDEKRKMEEQDEDSGCLVKERIMVSAS